MVPWSKYGVLREAPFVWICNSLSLVDEMTRRNFAGNDFQRRLEIAETSNYVHLYPKIASNALRYVGMSGYARL